MVTSCGSFRPVSYFNDGIYGDPPSPKTKYSKSSDGKYYKDYFGEKAEELANNYQNISIDTLATNPDNDQNVDSVTINVYGYGSHGFYHDYDDFYWGNYYHRPFWRHYRYRPWHYWSYHHYEPYYYGWSFYNPYSSYYPYYRYHPYYSNYGYHYSSNPNQYVKSTGRRGAPSRGSDFRANSSRSLNGQGLGIERRLPNGRSSALNINAGRRAHNSNSRAATQTSQQNKSSDFMTRDYSTKRNYRSNTSRKTYTQPNNSYQSRQTRPSNNHYNSSRSSSRSYSSGSSGGTSSSRGSSSRSSSGGRR